MADEAHEEGQLPFPDPSSEVADTNPSEDTYAATTARLDAMHGEHDDDTSWVPGHQPLEAPKDGFKRARQKLEAPHDPRLDYHDEVA